MLQCSSRLQPDSLFRILVVEEESVVVGVAESFDLGQTLTDLRTRVDHICLEEKNKEKIIKQAVSFV